MSENGKELSFTKTFPNLKALFRNTHVLVDITFTEKDVVRHRLVQDIIKAYERHEEGKRRNDRK